MSPMDYAHKYPRVLGLLHALFNRSYFLSAPVEILVVVPNVNCVPLALTSYLLCSQLQLH